jgi:hypothetical protein
VSTTIRIAVAFALADNDQKPVAGESLRLILGLCDQADPRAGIALVTDEKGEAAFAADAAVDRRWIWENVGFTGLSVPRRADHLAVAAELDQVYPTQPGAAHFAARYALDIFRTSEGTCRTTGFGRICAADAQGRFTVPLNRGRDLAIPGRVERLSGSGYRVTDFMLDRDDNGNWRLRLAFAKAPAPVYYGA